MPVQFVPLESVGVDVSTDGVSFSSFGQIVQPWPENLRLIASSPSPAEVKFIRYTLIIRSGEEFRIDRLYAFTHQEPIEEKKVEPIIPCLTSDGRKIFSMYVIKNKDEGEPKEEMQGEAKLYINVFDPLEDMAAVAMHEIPFDMNQSALHSSGITTNGENILFFSLHGVEGKPSWQVKLLSLQEKEVKEDREFQWEQSSSPSIVTQCYAYDLYNNFIWGLDPQSNKVCYWRNVGVAPRFHPRKPREEKLLLLSNIPSYRLEGLESASYLNRQGDTEVQAAKILSILDKAGEIYGVPQKSHEEDCTNEIVISSSGRDDGFQVKFILRGQNVWSSPGKGLNLVRLDKQYNVVECRSFDTGKSDGLYNEFLAEYVARIPNGTVMLVASKEECPLGPQGKKALRSLGADSSVEKLEASDIFVLIGKKGAHPSSVVQKIIKRAIASATIRQKMPFRNIPLAVEPTKAVRLFFFLIDIFHSKKSFNLAITKHNLKSCAFSLS